MSSRDHHVDELSDLEEWLTHIRYEEISDDIPDRKEDVEVDPSSIYIQGVPDRYLDLFSVICKAFPELKDEEIVLVFKKIPMTMQARPDIWHLLVGRRKYLILINDRPSNNGITLDDIPFNGQLGILAHEMCHILDYQHKSLWGIIKTGLMYLSDSHKESYEKSTDYLAVKKGFGLQLHTWAKYVLHEAPVKPKYRKVKERFYLRPEVIRRFILP